MNKLGESALQPISFNHPLKINLASHTSTICANSKKTMKSTKPFRKKGEPQVQTTLLSGILKTIHSIRELHGKSTPYLLQFPTHVTQVV